MNVLDLVQFGWLVALTLFVVIAIKVQRTVDRTVDGSLEHIRERVGTLEGENGRLRKHLREWARDMNR